MMLRTLLLSLMLGTAPAMAGSSAPVQPAVKTKKAAGASKKDKRPPASKKAVTKKAASKKAVAKKATPAKKKPVRPSRGQRVARRAAALVGGSLAASGKVPDDCSGLVRLSYQAVGIELLSHGTRPGENAVTAIYRRAKRAGALHRKRPRPGDLVFFRETYDRNRDGRRNDGLTHVGVIQSVEPDGTVVFVHRGGSGVSRARMNPRFPTLRRSRKGLVLNDYLRRAEAGTRARFTGELFVGYASASRL